MISAHPFIISNFSNPKVIKVCGEYALVLSQDNTIFLFQTQKLISKFSSNDQIQGISMKIFIKPFIVASCGMNKIIIYQNDKFDVKKIPIFLNVKFCSILSASIALVSDGNNVFYWNVMNDGVDLAFRTRSIIREMFTNQNTSFIFTSDCFYAFIDGNPYISLKINIGDNAKIFNTWNYSSFFILENNIVQRIDINENEIYFRNNVSLPSNLCIDICCCCDNELFALFNHEKKMQRYIRVFNYSKSEWSNNIDVPLVSSICWCNGMCLAGCNQYILILHKFPEIFDQILMNVSFHDIISNINDNSNTIYLFILFYGIESVYKEVFDLKQEKPNIISSLLEELWNQELYEMWSKLIIKYPIFLNDKVKRINEFIKSQKLIPFANVLYKAGNYDSSIQIYIKEKSIDDILNILPKINNINLYLSSIIEVCSEMFETDKKEIVKKIIYYFSTCIPPEKIIPLLIFNWNLIDTYYNCFDNPSTIIVNSYISAFAIHKQNDLKSFILNNKNYDPAIVSKSLLKLGCLEEYSLIIKQSDPLKYLQFLYFQEDFDEIFYYLKTNRNLIPFIIRKMSFDKSDFLELIRHFDSLGITLTQLVNSIPKETPVDNLIEGFQLLSHIFTSQSYSEKLILDICSNESNEILKEIIDERSKPHDIILE